MTKITKFINNVNSIIDDVKNTTLTCSNEYDYKVEYVEERQDQEGTSIRKKVESGRCFYYCELHLICLKRG